MSKKTLWFNSPYTLREKLNFAKYRIEAPCTFNHTNESFETGTVNHTFSSMESDFSIGFIGDFMPFGEGELTLDDSLRAALSELDYLVVNVEGVITRRTRYLALTHRLDVVEYIRQLFPCPVIFNVANNHSADFGEAEFRSHVDVLTASNPVVGMPDEALTLPCGIRLFASSRWSNQPHQPADHFDYADGDRLAAFFVPGAYNIFLPHWGYEMHLYPNDDQVSLAQRLLFNSACDAIVGSHPHVPQPVQIYGNKFVAYSMGNFCFRNVNPNHHFGTLLTMHFVTAEGQRPELTRLTTLFTHQAVADYAVSVGLTEQLSYFEERKKVKKGWHFFTDLIK